LGLHQRHAEHVEVITAAGAVGVEHIGAGDVVVVLLGRVLGRRHRAISVAAAVPPRTCENVDLTLIYRPPRAIAAARRSPSPLRPHPEKRPTSAFARVFDALWAASRRTRAAHASRRAATRCSSA